MIIEQFSLMEGIAVTKSMQHHWPITYLILISKETFYDYVTFPSLAYFFAPMGLITR